MADASQDFLNSLPRVADRPELRDASPGFSYVAAPDEAFIMPGLQRVADDSAAPSVILIEARAAVGKSMLARHLAWQAGAPLWDLSQVYVGSGTLWGSLARAFGPQQLNRVIGQMLVGEFVLIIDALDEAEMHAGGAAFDAFLIELRDMFATPRRSPSAVILGRAETIEYVDLFLGGQVPSRRYRIMDFERERACAFVDRRLDYGLVTGPGFTPGANRKREPVYIEARDRLFDFLADRLLSAAHGPPAAGGLSGPGEQAAHVGEWTARTRSFLGYAPVLEAIAEYLASYSASYQALIADLGAMERDPYNSGSAQWTMLRTIVRQLLAREQRKVVDQLRKMIPDSGDIEWTRVYTPQEQCAHILGRLTGRQELLHAGPDMPGEAKARYRDLLRNAIPNHPFLCSSGYANVVFRDYVHAWGLMVASEAAREAVRVELHADEYLPAPLLGPFVITGGDEKGPAVISGQDLGFVYESLLTQGDSRLFLYAEPGEDATVLVGNDIAADIAAFRVSRPDEGVRFWRRLARADVRGELTVQLGLPARRGFSLGPDVTLDVGIIEVPGNAVRVKATRRDGDVVVNASAGYVGGMNQLELSKYGDGELAVWWESPRYPWVEFAKAPLPAGGGTVSDERLHDAYLNLTRIARAFSFHSYHTIRGHLFLNDNTIGRQARNNPQLRSLFDWLVDQGIIVPQPHDAYFMSAGSFRALGISAFDILSRRETPEIRRFVEGFLRSQDDEAS